MAMRVLMFGWELPPHNSGGLGTACQGLLESLTAEGVEVTFVMPRAIDADSTGARLIFTNSEGVSVRYIDSLLTPYLSSKEYERSRRSQNGKTGLYGHSILDEVRRYAIAARKIAREEKFDIIHAHDWLSFGAGLAAKEVSGKPLIVHVHATQFDHNGGNAGDPALHAIEHDGIERADKVIAVSDYTKQLLIRHYKVDPTKIEVVHNGVKTEGGNRKNNSFNLKALKAGKAKIVLFLGRITLMKGPDYFIKAAEVVLRYEPNTYFLIAGAGDMERRMIELAASKGIGDKVLFVGFVRGDKRRALYEAADLYVLPSVSEPFGITPLEAMDAGTPVLISRQSGVSEAVQHALKVDFWDTDEMASKILSVLQHDSLAKTLSQNGAQEVLSVNWNKAAKKVQQVYRKIISFFKKDNDDAGDSS